MAPSTHQLDIPTRIQCSLFFIEERRNRRVFFKTKEKNGKKSKTRSATEKQWLYMVLLPHCRQILQRSHCDLDKQESRTWTYVPLVFCILCDLFSLLLLDNILRCVLLPHFSLPWLNELDIWWLCHCGLVSLCKLRPYQTTRRWINRHNFLTWPTDRHSDFIHPYLQRVSFHCNSWSSLSNKMLFNSHSFGSQCNFHSPNWIENVIVDFSRLLHYSH